MRVEVLRWFVALAEREHLGDTALDLHISQPALSRAIGALECELEVPLFDRRGRRLVLNDNGVLYLPAARRAVDGLDGAGRQLRARWSAEAGEVRLAFLHTAGEWMVPPLLRDLRARLPHVTFRLSQDAAGHIADRVGAGTADLGIVGPRPAGDLAWLELVQEPIRLVVPARHALAGRSHVGLREVARDSFVLLKRQYGLRSVVDGLLGAAGITPRVAFEAEDVGTLLGLVSAGLGTTLAPPTPQTVAPHAGVNVITIDDAHAHRSLGVIWDPSRTRAPGVDACLRHLLAVGPGLAVEAAARRAG